VVAGGPHHWPYFRNHPPEFGSYYSVASWYRDYVAYCGVSDDGKKLYAVVFQVGRRKPVLKKPLARPPKTICRIRSVQHLPGSGGQHE